jgi:uncharacterized repeat protein (TIGR03803 family)
MKPVSVALYSLMLGCASAQSVSATEAAKYKEEVVWSFGNGTDRLDPYAGLIDLKGTLYGTTEGGGLYGRGTVFSLDQKTGTETVLYSFCSKTNCADGAEPQASLTHVNGILYGTTYEGGVTSCGGSCGTVLSLDLNTGAEKVLYSFCSQANCADGRGPAAGLVLVKRTLYGTTLYGGARDGGTVFSIDPRTGAESVLYSFCIQTDCTDGAAPVSALIELNGMLYGTTSGGGASYDGCVIGCGTVFSINPNSGGETVLHSFGFYTDGAVPSDSLINVNGILYGTTEQGGTNNSGAIFSIDPSTGSEAVLYSFLGGKDGASPDANLIDMKGVLYGTTAYGGSTKCQQNAGCGTVFSLDPKTGAETVLYIFCG